MGFPDESDPFSQGRGATGDILAGYSSRADLLNSQAEMQRNDAMELMQRALTNAPQVTAQQGIAAALLAAIPTLGGALIGKAVGSNKIPQGMYGIKGLEPLGMSAGGAMGAEIGNKASQDFLTRLDRTKETTPIMLAQARLLNDQAQQTASQANQVENARLNAETDMNMIPLREQSQMRVQAASQAQSLANQLEVQQQRDLIEKLPPELLAKKQLTNEDLIGLNPSQVRVLTQWQEAQRRQQGQDTRLSGENFTPPSVATKKKMDDVLLTKQVGNQYLNELQSIASTNPDYITRQISTVLPATQIGALQKSLDLFAVQVRNARESGVMTEQDFNRYSGYLTIGPLDTFQSVIGRMKELQNVTDLSAKSTLMSAKAGRENVADYEQLLGYSAPSTFAELNQDPKAAQRAAIDAKIAALEAQINGQ
jgi:hypothetical protein